MFTPTSRSELRGNIANSQLQGAKYSGVKTSRELLAQGYDSNQSDSISIRSRDEEVLVSIDRRIDRSPAATDYDEEEESDGDASSQTHSEPRQNHGLEAQGLTSALRESRMADREKGKAIINQSVCLPRHESFKALSDARRPDSDFGTQSSMLG